MSRRISRHYGVPTFVWNDADAEAAWNRLTAANGGVEIDTFSLYGVDVTTLKTGLDNFFINVKAIDERALRGGLYFNFGGTTQTHAINYSIDGAVYDCTFFGSPIHSANGVEYNGLNQYANTNIEMNAHFPGTRMLGMKIKSAVYGSFRRAMGVQGTSTGFRSWLACSSASIQTEGVAMGGANRVTAPFSIDSGFVSINRISGGNNKLYLDGVLQNSANIAYNTQAGQFYWLGANNANGVFSSGLEAYGQFYWITGNGAGGFSDAQILAFSNEVNTLLAIIGR